MQKPLIDHLVIQCLIHNTLSLVIIVINISTRIILNTLKRHSSKTSNIWDDCVINSLYRPITILVWVLGIVFTLEAFNNDFKVINISYDFLNNLDISYLHVFTYSERTNTDALKIKKTIPNFVFLQ